MNKKLLTYIILIVLGYMVALYAFLPMSSIDVDKCLQKDNFAIVGDRIVETLQQETVIEKKGRAGYKGGLIIGLHVYDEKTKQKLPITINKAYIDNYDELNVGDKVLLTRKVYYTRRGVRLNYKDTLTPITDTVDNLPQTNSDNGNSRTEKTIPQKTDIENNALENSIRYLFP